MSNTYIMKLIGGKKYAGQSSGEDHLVLATDTDNEADVLTNKVEAISPIEITQEYTDGYCKLKFGISTTASWMHYDTILMTDSEYLANYGATKKQFIAAPGANKEIFIVGGSMFMDYNITPYAETFRYLYLHNTTGDVVGNVGTSDNFNGVSADKSIKIISNSVGVGINKGVFLSGSTQATNGNSSFKIKLVYFIMDYTI